MTGPFSPYKLLPVIFNQVSRMVSTPAAHKPARHPSEMLERMKRIAQASFQRSTEELREHYDDFVCRELEFDSRVEKGIIVPPKSPAKEKK